MINNSIIKLEDNNDYAVVDKIETADKTYVFLTNIKDTTDFCIRKETVENVGETEEKHFLEGLTEEEFDEAMNLFANKHKDEA